MGRGFNAPLLLGGEVGEASAVEVSRATDFGAGGETSAAEVQNRCATAHRRLDSTGRSSPHPRVALRCRKSARAPSLLRFFDAPHHVRDQVRRGGAESRLFHTRSRGVSCLHQGYA